MMFPADFPVPFFILHSDRVKLADINPLYADGEFADRIPIPADTVQYAHSSFVIPGDAKSPPSIPAIKLEAGSIVFPHPGEFYFYSAHGAFKFLVLPKLIPARETAVRVMQFVARNCVHSLADHWLGFPDGHCAFDATLLARKFFTSDQPLQLHCGEVVPFLAVLLHHLDFSVRQINLVDDTTDNGHVVLEVLDPDNHEWLMLDPDYGIYAKDSGGRILSLHEFLIASNGQDDVDLVGISEKYWISDDFHQPAGFYGQKTWRPEDNAKVRPVDIYREFFRIQWVAKYYKYVFLADQWRLSFEKIDFKDHLRHDSPASLAKGTPIEQNPKTNLMQLCEKHHHLFRLAGSITLDKCPVCFGDDHPIIWQLPLMRMPETVYLSAPGEAYDNTHLPFLPMLTTPQTIYVFDMCQTCGAVFLNPKDDAHLGYVNDTSKVNAIRGRPIETWRGATNYLMKFAPENTQVVVDAACGAGEILANARLQNPMLRTIGLEISKPAIEFIRSEFGIEGHLVDLDLDDLDAVVAPESVDYVIFNEAYEHVRTPTIVIKKLLRMLRPGGRLRYSAQAYGPELDLQIRPGEPIFISDRTLDWTIRETNTTLVSLEYSAKMYITLEKPMR